MCILPKLNISGITECLREEKDHASRSVGPLTDNFVLTGSNWEGVMIGKNKME